MTASSLRPAVFLDRDGVINENRGDYVKSLDEVRFIPGALAALARLARHPCLIVIVTNQSAIGRGLVARATVDAINAHIREQIAAAGGRVDGLYLCPHRPGEGCECRKPAPGLLLQAARDLDIDLSRSAMIGDALTDLQAARAAGVRSVRVLTGLALSQPLAPAEADHTLTVRDLSDAVEALAEEMGWLTKTPPA